MTTATDTTAKGTAAAKASAKPKSAAPAAAETNPQPTETEMNLPDWYTAETPECTYSLAAFYNGFGELEIGVTLNEFEKLREYLAQIRGIEPREPATAE